MENQQQSQIEILAEEQAVAWISALLERARQALDEVLAEHGVVVPGMEGEEPDQVAGLIGHDILGRVLYGTPEAQSIIRHSLRDRYVARVLRGQEPVHVGVDLADGPDRTETPTGEGHGLALSDVLDGPLARRWASAGITSVVQFLNERAMGDLTEFEGIGPATVARTLEQLEGGGVEIGALEPA